MEKIIIFQTLALLAGVALGVEPDLNTGIYKLQSNANSALFLTANTNGEKQEYTANTTVLKDTSDSTQLWYVQEVSYYPAHNIRLFVVSTRGPNTFNHVDSEQPEGSYYSYRANWRLIPANNKGSFAIEFFSMRQFENGSGLCLQHNGRDRPASFQPCTPNKPRQQWNFIPA